MTVPVPVPAADGRRLVVRMETVLGLIIAVGGLVETSLHLPSDTSVVLTRALISFGMGAAVAFHRRQPGLALGLVWAVSLVQVVGGLDVMATQLAVMIVAFGVARFGSRAVLIASGVSIPVGCLIAAAYLRERGTQLDTLLGISRVTPGTLTPAVVLTVAAGLLLVLPWLVGFAFRMSDRAAASRRQSARDEQARAGAETDRAQAEQLAQVRAEQTRLARDVHDVVGHSLTVILAQAESGHYLPDDPARLKATLANIAGSARTSLRDIRQILAVTAGTPPVPGGPPSAHSTGQNPHEAAGDAGPPAQGGAHLTVTGADLAGTGAPGADLDRLIDSVRDAGLRIETSTIGLQRALPPDLAVVAHRVLQEMLTNTIKHADPAERVSVTQTWGDGLTLEVSNAPRSAAADAPAGAHEKVGGHGLVGMHHRLNAVGGTLIVSRGPGVYSVRAWLPTRPMGSVTGPDTGAGT